MCFFFVLFEFLEKTMLLIIVIAKDIGDIQLWSWLRSNTLSSHEQRNWNVNEKWRCTNHSRRDSLRIQKKGILLSIMFLLPLYQIILKHSPFFLKISFAIYQWINIRIRSCRYALGMRFWRLLARHRYWSAMLDLIMTEFRSYLYKSLGTVHRCNQVDPPILPSCMYGMCCWYIFVQVKNYG